MVGDSQTKPSPKDRTRVLVVDDSTTTGGHEQVTFAATYMAYTAAASAYDRFEKERAEADRREALRVRRMKELWKQDQRAVNRRRHL